LKLQEKKPCSFFIFVQMAVDLRKYCKTNQYRSARKGRSESRLANRDEKLILRFYYYAVIRSRKFSDTIHQLSEEFDVAESVVTFRLKFNQETVDKVFADKPSVQYLKKRLPYYAW